MTLISIDFEFRTPSAESVCVAGTFNAWNPEAGVLTRRAKDHWVRTIEVPAGNHEYCLVVDGQWILDPQNAASVENSFGGRNSIFTAGTPIGSAQSAHANAAEHEVISHLEEQNAAQLRNRAAQLCQELASQGAGDSRLGRTSLGPRP